MGDKETGSMSSILGMYQLMNLFFEQRYQFLCVNNALHRRNTSTPWLAEICKACRSAVCTNSRLMMSFFIQFLTISIKFFEIISFFSGFFTKICFNDIPFSLYNQHCKQSGGGG